VEEKTRERQDSLTKQLIVVPVETKGGQGRRGGEGAKKSVMRTTERGQGKQGRVRETKRGGEQKNALKKSAGGGKGEGGEAEQSGGGRGEEENVNVGKLEHQW